MKEIMLPPASAVFLFCSLIDGENGSDTFLQNVGTSPNYTENRPLHSHHRECPKSNSDLLLVTFNLVSNLKLN
jgi:hypothetical protein